MTLTEWTACINGYIEKTTGERPGRSSSGFTRADLERLMEAFSDGS